MNDDEHDEVLLPEPTPRLSEIDPNDRLTRHEALHTAWVLLDTFSEHVCKHPSVIADPVIEELADTAVGAMSDLYQACANRWIK